MNRDGVWNSRIWNQCHANHSQTVSGNIGDRGFGPIVFSHVPVLITGLEGIILAKIGGSTNIWHGG